MFKRFLSHPNFLIFYCAAVTIAFIITTCILIAHPVLGASKLTDFDRIRVHRIDVVEPDGIPRVIISNRADYPGSFYHGKEVARPDRADSAGMLFINDEGTEDGGLIFGGARTDGKPASFSHLSFDQYEQDQTVVMGTELFPTGEKTAGIYLSERPDSPITPALYDEATHIKSMPHGSERQAAWAEFMKKYPAGQERASLARSTDGAIGLSLKDPQGRVRLKLTVASNGEPAIQLLDEKGQIKRSLLIGDSSNPEQAH
ncbi:MAG TPA: hypothetical protein VF214_04020 [Edaphobacter sp.]